MAEYYPLLARAVSAQPSTTPEIRSGIYERARKALLGQLRSQEPPLSQEDIDREARALEDAIARVEAEQAASAASPAPEAAAAKTAPAAAGAAAAVDSSARPRAPSLAERAKAHRESLAAKAAKPATAPAGEAEAPAAERVVAAPIVVSEAGPSAGHAPLVAPEPKAELAADPKNIPKSGLLWKFGRGNPNGQAGPIEIPAGPRDEPLAAGATAIEAEEDPASLGVETEPFATRPAARPRPLAPLAAEEPRRISTLYWALGFVAALIVVGVAVMAYLMKDTPQTVVASKAPPASAKAPGKIIDRIGIGPTKLPEIADKAGSLAPAGTLGASEGAPPNVGVAQTKAPHPAASSSAPAATAANAQPSVAASSPSAASSANVAPVAQRAALLLQAPTASDPQAIATYVGTVVWRLETVDPGPGKPAALAVRAEVDVPDAKLKASMLLEKNFDPSLPASHTIELRFMPQPGSVVGDVKQIDTPQMRKEDSPAGDPLAGIPTPITENYFLVGLAKGDPAQSNNIELMRSAGWFDVPMLLANGKIAKITFEKGVAGQKVLEDAFASWSSQ